MDQPTQNAEAQKPETSIKLRVNDFRFNFAFAFDTVPTAEEIIQSIVTMFQNASFACMEKESLTKLLEDSKNQKIYKYAFTARLGEDGIEANYGLLKEASQIIGSDKELVVPVPTGPLNRAERRRNLRGL